MDSKPETIVARVEVNESTREMIEGADSALMIAQSFVVEDYGMAELVSQRRNELLQQIKKLEEMQKQITAPAEQIIATARGWFKPAIERCKEAEKLYAQRLLEFRQREKARIEAHNAARQQVPPADPMVAAAVALQPAETVQKIAGTSFRSKWVPALKDGIDEAEAKRLIAAATVQQPSLLGLLDVNGTALRKMAEALHEAMDVPGYKAIETEIAAGKRK